MLAFMMDAIGGWYVKFLNPRGVFSSSQWINNPLRRVGVVKWIAFFRIWFYQSCRAILSSFIPYEMKSLLQDTLGELSPDGKVKSWPEWIELLTVSCLMVDNQENVEERELRVMQIKMALCALLSHSVQGIFPNQGLNPGLPNGRQILYQMSYQGSPLISI